MEISLALLRLLLVCGLCSLKVQSALAQRCVTMDWAERVPLAAPAFAQAKITAGAGNGLWAPGDVITDIDTMVLYTPRAVEAHGDEASLREGIERVVASANRNFTNSLVGIRLDPVFIGLHAAWIESGDMQTDFNLLRNDAQIASMRNDYKADLVYLIIETDKNGFGGGSTMLGNPAGDASRAFCIYRRTAIVGNPTWTDYDGLGFTHETGHSLGAGHDREHGFGTRFQGMRPVFTFGNGYRFESHGITYRTAMGYDPGVQIPLFSNPNITFDEHPLGVPAGQPGEADNAQTLNRMAPIVAAYRSAESRIGFANFQFIAPNWRDNAEIHLVRTGNLSAATAVTIAFDGGTAKENWDYTRPENLTVQFAPDQSDAVFRIPIRYVNETRAKTIRLRVVNPQAGHGLGAQSTTVVTIYDFYTLLPGSTTLTLLEGQSESILFGYFNISVGGMFYLGVSAESHEEDLLELPTTIGSETSEADYLTITAKADDLDEPDETARINVGGAIVTVTILDSSRAGSRAPAASPNAPVTFLRSLPEGGVLAGGDFTEVSGQPRTALAKLKADGSLDTAFSPPELRASSIKIPGMPPARVMCATPLARGGWLVGGIIGLANGMPARNLVYINNDGSLNNSFNHPGLDGMTWTIAEATDGKVYVGGIFDHVGSENIRSFVRLNADGSIDRAFKLAPGMGGDVVGVSAIGLLPNGKILVAGRMTVYNNTPISNLIRLNSDGSLDQTFPLLAAGAATQADCIAILPDGRAYVAGFFESIGGRDYKRIARLNADGTVDLSFRAPQPNGEILDLAPLPNGQLLVGGGFTAIAGINRRFITLLNEDGTIASNFDPGIGGGDHTWTLAAGGDGMLTIGGSFQTYNLQASAHLARIRLPATGARLTGVSAPTSGKLTAKVLGLPGGSYTIETTSDFNHWTTEGTVRVDTHDGSSSFEINTDNPATYLRLRTDP